MTIPKRIIFSRKGFDSTGRYGGSPSPIFDGKRLLSLPIPEDKKMTIRYLDLLDPSGQFPSLGPIVEQLTKSKLDSNRFAHLDPDLRRDSVSHRKPGWREIFGQVDQSQTHLCNQGIGKGDLFLFYGLYRNVTVTDGEVRYVPGEPAKHVIWGWLTVGEVLKVSSETDGPEWAHYHPHFTDQRALNNTVYVADDRVFEELPGAGVFENYHPDLCLTYLAQKKIRASHWILPKWCVPRHGQYPLTYHRRDACWQIRDDQVVLQTKSPGQEFVLNTDTYPEALEWAKNLIKRGIDHTR
ncbi:MAG: hypothetical protein JWQ87_3883 [Candidatus Sulfotelmatobacter sp.]|nr:hypothetical protein [Candidatus Sulfotelmatobacter sp.]